MLLTALELLRSIIDHRKVFVLALNGPAVGGGAAWFTGVADIVLASKSCYLQVPFSALGLVPENGSAINFAQSMGVHRANDFLMFGRKLSIEDLEQWGMVNRVFEHEGFHGSVKGFLEEQLKINDGKSMVEMKRLQNAPLRDARMVAVYNSMDALAERFVDGAPMQRFVEKKKLLDCKLFLYPVGEQKVRLTSTSEIEKSDVEDLEIAHNNVLKLVTEVLNFSCSFVTVK